ncbi:PREDICTED: uncharacterized protein LOC109233814 [Nicotiana attenuata]|uniref:Uncharacterized protein n=1 Tax=Nicotiana attenuata TaxID=49451 RepID=A0A1J6IIB0_NICAT|nr:PREDICTED: uncharacterized protein LOC109233814 [Nicotiana attenuata]OIS97462.1 hypothetical protein A4A49_16432 [Nicotiana attenuata]
MNPLDSIVVKRIEEKEKVKKKSIIRQKTVSICCKGKGQFVPMKVEIQETSSKNSLLDRLTSLETRLFQLCLEIEAAKTTCSSNIQTPFTERSRNDAKKQTDWNSYPTFDYPKPPCKSQSQLSVNECESSQNKSHMVAQDLEQSSNMKKQLQFGRSKSTKDGKNTSKNGKKNLKASWPHLRILGC